MAQLFQVVIHLNPGHWQPKTLADIFTEYIGKVTFNKTGPLLMFQEDAYHVSQFPRKVEFRILHITDGLDGLQPEDSNDNGKAAMLVSTIVSNEKPFLHDHQHVLMT